MADGFLLGVAFGTNDVPHSLFCGKLFIWWEEFLVGRICNREGRKGRKELYVGMLKGGEIASLAMTS
jgi:hypothetical protein